MGSLSTSPVLTAPYPPSGISLRSKSVAWPVIRFSLPCDGLPRACPRLSGQREWLSSGGYPPNKSDKCHYAALVRCLSPG